MTTENRAAPNVASSVAPLAPAPVTMRRMEFEDGRIGWFVDHTEFYCDIEPDSNGVWSVFFRDKDGKEAYGERVRAHPGSDIPEQALKERASKPTDALPLPDEHASLSHRGFAYSRTEQVPGFRDTQREKALAQAWIAENPPAGRHGVQPVLAALVPDCTERDAQVAATVVQWMGSSVGFYFLEQTLANAGYSLKEIR